jgi:hypothetical protein
MDPNTPMIIGNGKPPCDEEKPTLSVATENLIETKAQWDEFTGKNPFFVLGATDSKCKKCCETEPLLNVLE